MDLESSSFFVPEYMLDFKCVGEDCIDSCCIGWNVEIDKKTYQKYENSTNKKIKSISQNHLVKRNLNSNITYARLINHNNCCPFLNEKKLCNVYNLLGKENLSVGCSTYPRIIRKFNKTGFIAGELSCPEMAKLCLNKSNLKINTLKKNKLPNVFNSNNIHSYEISKNLPEKFLKYIEGVFLLLSSNITFYGALKQIIISYNKMIQNKKSSQPYSKNEVKKIKENSPLIQTNFLAKLCFSNFTGNTRYQEICKKSAATSKYFDLSEKEFKKKFDIIYRTKFYSFKKENEFIFKNFFVNEFIKNIQNFIISENSFYDSVREVIFFIELTNFLLVCQLFEENKKLSINNFVEVLSAAVKQIQSSRQKIHIIINFLKKIPDDNLLSKLLNLKF